MPAGTGSKTPVLSSMRLELTALLALRTLDWPAVISPTQPTAMATTSSGDSRPSCCSSDQPSPDSRPTSTSPDPCLSNSRTGGLLLAHDENRQGCSNGSQSTIPSSSNCSPFSTQCPVSSVSSASENIPTTPTKHNPKAARDRPPRLNFFGIHLAALPVTAPSFENPRVNPLPVSLGIEVNQPGTPNLYNPTMHIIHARRVNIFDHTQQQVFLTLNDPRSADLGCPSYIALHNNRSKKSRTFFWADVFDPAVSEVLMELVEKGLIGTTGNMSSTGAQEYEVLIGMHALSKKCERCGRWEAVVEEKREGSKEKWSYRRWAFCAGCEHCYFCREECAQLAWCYHWEVCLRIRRMLGLE